MLNRAALGAIWLYQTYLSPRKGYRCAYSVLHGGPGCSGYVKHAIQDYGLWRGWPRIRARFAECQTAYATLMAQREQDAKAKRRTRTKDSACNLAECGLYGASAACSGSKKRVLDTNPCDGDCGVGACSCDINPCS